MAFAKGLVGVIQQSLNYSSTVVVVLSSVCRNQSGMHGKEHLPMQLRRHKACTKVTVVMVTIVILL